MHIYGFGSICRGEIAPDSDVDLLIIGENYDSRFDPDIYSIYSYDRIQQLWCAGNPFAWHLALESRLLFASDGEDYMRSLGKPRQYQHCHRDCGGFLAMFCAARTSILEEGGSIVFDLSTIFLSIRNIATCFSLGVLNRPDFSRSSALHLGADSLSIPKEPYQVFERARVLCTRGLGVRLTVEECDFAVRQLDRIHEWMCCLVRKAEQK